jgi:hypothetical protein
MRIGNGEYVDASGHQGIDETIKYLSNLGSTNDSTNNDNTSNNDSTEQEDANLVWRFSSWVLRKRPAKAVNIFINSSRPYELNPDRVLEFFLSFVPSNESSNGASSGSDDNDWPRQARIAYLEYLTERTGINKVEQHYHTMLALELVHMTVHVLEHGWKEKREGDHGRERLSSSIIDFDDLANRLANPGGSAAAAALTRGRRRGNTTSLHHGSHPPVRKKLLQMLKTSKEYNNQKLLTATEGKGLHEERVILLSNVKLHDEALKTIVHNIKDLNVAEKYCKYCI